MLTYGILVLALITIAQSAAPPPKTSLSLKPELIQPGCVAYYLSGGKPGPEKATPGHGEGTEKAKSGHEEGTEKAKSGHEGVTEKPKSGHEEVAEKPKSGHEEIKEKPKSGHEEVAEKPKSGHEEGTEKPKSGHEEVAEKPKSGHEEVAEKPKSGHEEGTEKPKSGHEEVKEKPKSGHEEVAEKPKSGHEEGTEKPKPAEEPAVHHRSRRDHAAHDDKPKPADEGSKTTEEKTKPIDSKSKPTSEKLTTAKSANLPEKFTATIPIQAIAGGTGICGKYDTNEVLGACLFSGLDTTGADPTKSGWLSGSLPTLCGQEIKITKPGRATPLVVKVVDGCGFDTKQYDTGCNQIWLTKKAFDELNKTASPGDKDKGSVLSWEFKEPSKVCAQPK